MTDVTFVTFSEFSLDGIGYTINVYRRSDAFHAVWECKQCANQDSLPAPAQHRDAAIAKCNQLIELHHARWHVHARIS